MSDTADRAQAIALSILEAFRDGLIPKTLARTLLMPLEIPSARWSLQNRLLVALAGHTDARGFRQWREVGRSVRKGERACYILKPNVGPKKTGIDDSGQPVEETSVYGFIPVAVFGFDQTEGEPLTDVTESTARFLAELPLREVAEEWAIPVAAMPFNGAHAGIYRTYGSPHEPKDILLATDSLKTWLHELTHAADHRQGALKPNDRNRDRVPEEIVAELGAATLLESLGLATEDHHAASWAYLLQQGLSPSATLTLAHQLLERTASAIALILDTGAEIRDRGYVPPATSVLPVTEPMAAGIPNPSL